MLELYHWEPNIFFLKPMLALAEKGIESWKKRAWVEVPPIY